MVRADRWEFSAVNRGASWMDSFYKQQLRFLGKAVLKGIVLVAGMALLLIGIVMIVTPGPAIILIPAGLALLATEFVWARQLLDQAKPIIERAVQSVRAKREAKQQASTPGHAPVEPPGEPGA
jgi:uncharacterized protein (TIGR02611 family)